MAKADSSIQEILEQIEVMIQKSENFKLEYQKENEIICQKLYEELICITVALQGNYPAIQEQMPFAYYNQMVQNISYTLEKLSLLINENESDRAAVLLEFQLIPFLQELWEEVYYWGTIYPDKDKMDDYYSNEFALHHENRYEKSGKLKYKVSIFIPVYNKLEYTKQCIESLYKHTDFVKHNCEIILINDGSYDGTQTYFESLGVNKIIHFKENVKAAIFSLAIRICEGEFVAFVNNDTILAENWLDNLLLCLESDSKIICAAPVTSCAANHQGYSAEYNSIKEFEEFTRAYNVSDPKLWIPRARIMPVIALYRLSLVNQIGFADRLFYTMEFWDDDFSMRARRAGYKQMFCRDTYSHHFGSITGGAVRGEMLKKGRDLFLKKNKVDPWMHDFAYNLLVSAFLRKYQLPWENPVRILGIDCGFGDTINQMKYICESQQKKAVIYNVSSDARFLADLKPISEECMLADISTYHFSEWKDKVFHIVYMANPLEMYQEPLSILKNMSGDIMFAEGGFLFCSISNPYYLPCLENHIDTSKYLDLEYILSELRAYFPDVYVEYDLKKDLNVEAFVNQHFPEHQGNEAFMRIIQTERFQLFCKK